GRALVGGLFAQRARQPRHRVARLTPDRSLDAGFNPGANRAVRSLAVQADGKVLVGGVFTQLGGQPRNHLARLSLPEAALQELGVSADRSILTWQRSGAGPELERVWFELSSDGVAYTPLGEASRTAGGWTLGGLGLPQNQKLW